MGKNEVIHSNVIMTESGKGCGLGRGEYRPGDMRASSPGTSGIKRNTPDLFFLKRAKIPFLSFDQQNPPQLHLFVIIFQNSIFISCYFSNKIFHTSLNKAGRIR